MAKPSDEVMGLGAGGTIKQKVYPDPYGIDTWDQRAHGHVAVHLLNSVHFRRITGIDPPPTPIDAKAYADRGLPWFDLYDETRGDIAVPERFVSVGTIAANDAKRGEYADAGDSFEVPESDVVRVRRDPDKGGVQ
jgi:hypothetical protein